MALLPAYYSTSSTKRRIKSKSKKQLRLDEEHQRFLKKLGYSGKASKSRKPTIQSSKQAEPTTKPKEAFYHPTSAKREPNVYSGERTLLGIATMHKSNMVPVFSQEDAESISKMRR